MSSISSLSTEQSGAISFGVAMGLEQCVTPYLARLLERFFQLETPSKEQKMSCKLVHEEKMQLRGIDAVLYMRGREWWQGPCSIDFKVDTHESGNIALELISQSTSRKLGYPFKDARWVVYYFVRTGDIFFLDMSIVTPWLRSQWNALLENNYTASAPYPYQIASTPNKTYESFSLLVPDGELLKQCPDGVFLVRLADHAPLSAIQSAMNAYNRIIEARNIVKPTSTPPKLLSYVNPDSIPRRTPILKTTSPTQAAQKLLKGANCLSQDKPHAIDIEKMTRLCEARSIIPKFKIDLSKQIRQSRRRLFLEEDRLPV